MERTTNTTLITYVECFTAFIPHSPQSRRLEASLLVSKTCGHIVYEEKKNKKNY
jgi:hypothetical protein